MKRIAFAILLVFLWASTCQAVDPRFLGLLKKPAAALSCNTTTPWVQGSNTQNDYWSNNHTQIAQKIKVPAAVQICMIDIYARGVAGANFEFWSDLAQAGTKYGNTIAGSFTGSFAWTTIFNNSTTTINLPGDAYFHIIGSAGSVDWGATTPNGYTTGYNLWWNGGEQAESFMFRIYTMQ